MEHRSDLGQPSACHGPDFGEHHPQEVALERVYALVGDLPRMFALVQDFTEVVAYGLALPGGTATTVGANGRGFGLWASPRSAARRLHSDLVWFGNDGAQQPTS
ncbi:hypothetical protein AB0K21_44505 [Streptosporangium sp. NPDC049248]|uniref:hypothetical protein n=1 Tax=Streptosporangium sp. NPDC049248 TaxID=3155651 RepID=UPI00341538DD